MHQFTVFTPTYNRAHTLPKVYASLQQQSCRDFEWLVVDDGSTDNTKALVERWASEASFPIRYIYQTNGHKKKAINTGVRHAQGALFLILDSDDEIVPHALQILLDAWLAIPADERTQYAGVTGLCIDQHGQMVGSKFPQDVMDSDAINIRYNYTVTGEKWGFNTTQVMREFPFPEEIPGLVSEALIWNRIARRYKMRFINQVLRIYHDEADSLTRTNMGKNAQGFHLFYTETICQEWHYVFKRPSVVFRIAANAVRFALHLRQQGQPTPLLPSCALMPALLALISLPVAYWFYRKDLTS